MMRKLNRIMASLFLGIMVCYIYLPGECEHPGMFPFAGGIVQPFATSQQYDETEPPGRRQLTTEERVNLGPSAPGDGAGMIWTWRF